MEDLRRSHRWLATKTAEQANHDDSLLDLENFQNFLIVPAVAATGRTQIDRNLELARRADSYRLISLIGHGLLAFGTGCICLRRIH